MFAARRMMQTLAVAGALLASEAAMAADSSQDRQTMAQASPHELHSRTACTCVCKHEHNNSAVQLSPPGEDAEIDRLRAQGG